MQTIFSIVAVFVGVFGGSMATYGAIRADLARAIALADAAVKSADNAHERIDTLILKGN